MALRTSASKARERDYATIRRRVEEEGMEEFLRDAILYGPFSIEEIGRALHGDDFDIDYWENCCLSGRWFEEAVEAFEAHADHSREHEHDHRDGLTVGERQAGKSSADLVLLPDLTADDHSELERVLADLPRAQDKDRKEPTK